MTANTAAAADTSTKSDDQKKENTSNTYQVGKTVDTHVTGAGAIKRLTIALMLNERKPATAGGKPSPRTPEEIKQIEDIVKEAVGFTTSDTRQDSIQSQEVAFADMFDDGSAPAAAKKASLEDQINQYLPYVTQGCLALLAVGILLYFRSVFLSTGAKADATPDSFEALLNNYTIQTNGGAAPLRHSNGTPNVLTPQELSRLIRENPDNASQALKAWLRRN